MKRSGLLEVSTRGDISEEVVEEEVRAGGLLEVSTCDKN